MKRRKPKWVKDGRQSSAGGNPEQTDTISDGASTNEEDETMSDRDDRISQQQSEPESNDGETQDTDHGTSFQQAAYASELVSEPPNTQLLGRDINYELIPEPARSTYFVPRTTDSQDEDLSEEGQESEGETSASDSDRIPDTVPEVVISSTSTQEINAAQIPLPEVPAPSEERLIFDAWDNRQVKSINKKAKETVEKAGLELGDHSVDSIFKGSYMAVLNPRSKEFKRFRKLWKHPELMIDPRRWTEWTGAAAVKRYCLSEGVDVSFLTGSHFLELYYVKDRDLILVLAEQANTNHYNVRQLKQAIADLKEERDDPDAGKAIIKTLDQSLPLLEDADLVALCGDKERLLQELSKAERKKILTLVKKRIPGLAEWKALMENLEGILKELEEG